MKIFFSLLLLLAGGVINSCAQITFQKTYGGTGDDRGFSVEQTQDGGYIIGGYTTSFGAGGQDVYLIKTDLYGDTLWTKTFGGVNEDLAVVAHQTSDNGYILCGSTKSFGAGNLDVYLIKTDGNGNVLWEKTFGTLYIDDGAAVRQTVDGGYIVTGDSNGDIYLIKTDSFGNLTWIKTIGGTDDETGYDALPTPDGGYFIVSQSLSFGSGSNQNIYLFKTDALGNVLWSKTYGSATMSIFEFGISALLTSDGNFIITGGKNGSSLNNYAVALMKTNSNGDTLWTKFFDRQGDDYSTCVKEVNSGGYILGGITRNSDLFLTRTDTSGNILWTKSYGGTLVEDCWLFGQTSDNGFCIAGSTNSFGAGGYDIYFIKTDSSGNSGCNDSNVTMNVIVQTTLSVTSVTPTVLSVGISTTPTSVPGSGGIVSTLCSTIGIEETNERENIVSVFPNPTQEHFSLHILSSTNEPCVVTILDVTGREAFHTDLQLETGENNYPINIAFLSQGLYLVKIKGKKVDFVGKVMKQQ